MSDMIEVITEDFNILTGETTIVVTLEPAPTVDPPTIEDYKSAVQSHIDAAAVSRLYTDGNSLSTYATSTIPQWAAEAQVFIAWRDAVWAHVYVMWADPPDPPPTIEELIASLPVIAWP